MKSRLFATGSSFFSQGACLFVLSVVTITTVISSSTSNAIEIKGMSYIAWDANGLFTPESDISLANTKKIGCNWIAMNVCWFQDDVNSIVIEPDYSRYSSTPESVIYAIDKCHELGMKVMLKPLVECRDDAWRGKINPSTAWFAAYQNFINFWAGIAEEHNVELFCVGCEFMNTTTWSSSWRNIAQGVRSSYTGPLIYAANPDEEKNITWWDELDYIGIDTYYPLTDINNPTLTELETAWNNRADAIEDWRNSFWPNMKIIFTEVGYRSIDGTNRTPWQRPSPPYQIDLQEQADCYIALLNQCKDRPWWLGAFWWNWEVEPDFGGPNDPHFSPHNKPAETVLANYYVCLRCDLTGDYTVDFEDLSTLAAWWLFDNPSIDIYPAPDGDSTINYWDFAAFTKNWMANVNLDGDINGDCKVDFEDLSRLRDQWLKVCKPGSLSEDINRDGFVNLTDYVLLAGSWAQASPP